MTDYRHLAYLDNAATAPTADEVIDVIDRYYQNQKVNVHRGMYTLAHEVTERYEAVRDRAAQFLNAQHREEIIFTSGATNSLNLVAFGYAQSHLQAGDDVIISVMEHHSNLVPWQQVTERTGANLKFVGIDAEGQIDIEQLKSLLSGRPKIVSLTMVSNVLGSMVDLQTIANLVHQSGAILVVDAAQAVAHMPIDVQDPQIDFLACSGHKMFGPTGIGILYGRKNFLNAIVPIQFGGEMIDQVELTHTTFQPLPLRLEAGTPNVAGVLGLGAAIKTIQQIGYDHIQGSERNLMDYLLERLKRIPHLTIYGAQSANQHVGVVSFNIDNVHAHDVATILDANGVAVRAGHHCAEPLMKILKVSSVVRVSISYQNTRDEIERLIAGLRQVEAILL